MAPGGHAQVVTQESMAQMGQKQGGGQTIIINQTVAEPPKCCCCFTPKCGVIWFVIGCSLGILGSIWNGAMIAAFASLSEREALKEYESTLFETEREWMANAYLVPEMWLYYNFGNAVFLIPQLVLFSKWLCCGDTRKARDGVVIALKISIAQAFIINIPPTIWIFIYDNPEKVPELDYEVSDAVNNILGVLLGVALNLWYLSTYRPFAEMKQ